jgi:hypothetical protein
MGCDIHMTYQKVGKKKKRDELLSELLGVEQSKEIMESPDWEDIDDGTPAGKYGAQFSEEWRNYKWFGRMSEVRSDGPRITHAGLPDDYEYLGWDEEFDEDNELGPHDHNHSHSHIYLNELLEVEWTNEDRNSFSVFMDDDIPRMTTYCDERNIKYEDFRVLISYDS